ncbi:helix-turn-helix transcriptional regulator [Gordonia soli]|uniref:Putative LuxR family transcriptional regulator n=1 Tax=Gordonia soli NBRC 108243 TaxID=1223545 RepID=M0QFF8_9ACTN|nr:LuxR C-terminal-related transcriptional regulator [Gordonia soli]GAC67194.1 putative LuxR family transcriptional regulator [Gordonia soli NBRC 108243]
MAVARSWRSELSRDQLLGIVGVLEDCENADGGAGFTEVLVDSIGRNLGVRDVTFFQGGSFPEIFDDPAPLLTGAAAPLLSVYRERWRDKDVFAMPQARRVLTTDGFASLQDLSRLPGPQRSYVVDYLNPNDMQTASALHLPFADGEALVGMFETVRSWDRSDLLAVRMLARQLRSRTATITLGATAARDPLDDLTPRQTEVAELVSDGLSNGEIATALSLSELSIKKYISRIFDVTGHRNRSELATAVLRREHGRRHQGRHQG